jgi:uncharacterized surface protein with fasciclin (FAS1) repeats
MFMKSTKPIITGVVLLIVASLVGLGIYAATNTNNETTEEQVTTQTEPTEEATDPNTITDLAVATPSLSTLVTALTTAELAETLADENAEYTVFAPNDDAFGKLPAGTVESLLLPESRATLTQILTYHVVSSAAFAADLSDGQVITTLEGQDLTVSIENDTVFIVDAKGGRAQVITADVRASNGVVHHRYKRDRFIGLFYDANSIYCRDRLSCEGYSRVA